MNFNYLLLIKEKFIKGSLDLKVEDYYINYYVQQAKSKIDIDYQQNNFLISIKTNLDVDITENTSKQRLINNKLFLKKLECYNLDIQ